MHVHAFFLHIVNNKHRNLRTLRRFMHDVLLLENYGSFLCFACYYLPAIKKNLILLNNLICIENFQFIYFLFRHG